MAKFYLFLLLSFTVLHACSQAPAVATEKPAAAMEKPKPPAGYASDKEGWLVDMEEAYAASQKNGKPILANFTGSDWCGWCKRLDAAVFSKPEFKTWAQKNVVLLELDFPRGKQVPQKIREQNAAMQNALQITGFPTVWVFNLAKDPTSGLYNIEGLGKTGYTPTAEEFIATVDKMVNP